MKDVLWTTIRDVVIDHYADTEGTLNRTKFWLFILLQTALYGCIIAICGFVSAIPGALLYAISAVVVLLGVLQFALCLPTLGALVRRLKDSNNSPWLLLLVLVPFIGAFIVAILLLLPTKQHAVEGDVPNAHMGSAGKVVTISIVLLAVTIGGFNMGMDRFEDSVINEWTSFTKIEPGVLTSLANRLVEDEESTKIGRHVIANYYASLRNGDYKNAYRALTMRQRERYGTYETWQRSLNPADLRSIESIDLSSITLETVDDIPHITYIVYFEGVEYPQAVEVLVTPVDDDWRIENIKPYSEEEE